MIPQRADGNDAVSGDRVAAGDADSADVTAFRATADAALFGFKLKDDAWFGQLRGVALPRTQKSLGKIGEYELISVIGHGGQGIVYKARQPRTGREVAIKRLAAGQFATPEMRARFQREVEAVAALDHPNIVTVFGSEELNIEPILVMQWVDGVPFDHWARPVEGIHRPIDEILAAFVKVCDAVAHAHQRGIIHRDLKPSNVLVDIANEPHVLDFGLARRDEDSLGSPTLTLSGAVLGTPAFSPPEQLRGEMRKVDARSDVYSLGAMLYRALTGNTPVDSNLSPFAMAERIEHIGPRSPADLNPALNREICSILSRSLRGDPAERYPSVKDISEDVQRYQSGRPVLAHPPGSAYRLRKFARRNSPVLIAVGIVTLTFVAAMVSNWFHSRRADDATARELQARGEFQRLEANRSLDEILETAITLHDQDKFVKAEALYRDVLARRRELVGDDHPSVIPVASKLAVLLRDVMRFDEADPFYKLAFDAAVSQYGMAHAGTIEAGNQLAGNRIRIGDYQNAEQICLSLPRDDVTVRLGGDGSYLVRALVLQQKFPEAIDAASLGLKLDKVKYGNGHRYVAADHQNLGDMYRRAGDMTRARAEFEAALTHYEDLVQQLLVNGTSTDLVYTSKSNTGYLKYRLGRLDEAEADLRDAFAGKFPNQNLVGKSRRGAIVGHFGAFLLNTGRAEEGERLLIEGQGMIIDPNYILSRFFLVLDLIDYYESSGRREDAAHWRDCLKTKPFREWLPKSTTSTTP